MGTILLTFDAKEPVLDYYERDRYNLDSEDPRLIHYFL